MYLLTMVRAIIGTRYPFIIFLVGLLCISNLGATGSVLASRYAGNIMDSPEVEEKQQELRKSFAVESWFTLLRDCCFNVAIWSYCFRYWNIANVLPMTVKGVATSLTYRIVSTISLVVGLLLNLIFPVIYSYYGYMLNLTRFTNDGVSISFN